MIDHVHREQGLDAAELIARQCSAELWARLAGSAEAADVDRAFAYAQRAAELDPRGDYLRLAARLGIRLGQIRMPERLLSQWSSAEDPGSHEHYARILDQIRAKRQLLDEGYPLSPRRERPIYVPIPRKVMYCLHNSLPHHNAGYATRSHEVLRSVQALGITMLACTRAGYPWDMHRGKRSADLPDFAVEDVVDGVVYRRLPAPDGFWGEIPIDRYVRMCADQIVQVARVERPALLHAASNHVVGLATIAAARELGVPAIYEVRGLWEITRISRQPEWQKSDEFALAVCLETQAAMEADGVLAITGALRDELVRRGVPESRITVVPNSVDARRFAEMPRDRELERSLGLEGLPVVGYIGSFTQYEGLDDLLVAVKSIVDRAGDFRVLLVGDGAEKTHLETLIRELDLERYVILPGRVPFEDVSRYYSLIDIAVFPRKPLPVTEMVSPMKPFEAMAMEKAVLVSSVAALAEIVRDGETGIVFEKGNVDELAEELLRMLRDEALRLRLGAQAREWVAINRSWSRAAASITDRYRALEGAISPPVIQRVPPRSDRVSSSIDSDAQDTLTQALLDDPWNGRTLILGGELTLTACRLALAGVLEFAVLIEQNCELTEWVRGVAAENGIATVIPTVGMSEQLPFADRSFDHVLVSATTEMALSDAALREASRVLGFDGTLMVAQLVSAGDAGDSSRRVRDLDLRLAHDCLEVREYRRVESWDISLLGRALCFSPIE